MQRRVSQASHLLHVGDGVDDTARRKAEGILAEQRVADDAPPMIRLLEVRILPALGRSAASCVAAEARRETHWKEEEHLPKLPLAEVVWQVLLGVGAQAGDVGVLARVLLPQRQDALLHVLCDLRRQAEELCVY